MTGYRFSQRSIDSLKGVHPDLVACVVLALYNYTKIDFMVIEGVRSIEDQRAYFEEGVSWTMKSKHLLQLDNTAWAVDLAPIKDGVVPWDRFDLFERVADAMNEAAEVVGVSIRWGGDWEVKDGPHFELRRR